MAEPMSFLRIFLGFALGLLFLGMGVLVLLAGQWIGGILLLISLLLLPPVRWWVYRRTGRQMSTVLRTFLVASLLALFVILFESVARGMAEENQLQFVEPSEDTTNP